MWLSGEAIPLVLTLATLHSGAYKMASNHDMASNEIGMETLDNNYLDAAAFICSMAPNMVKPKQHDNLQSFSCGQL